MTGIPASTAVLIPLRDFHSGKSRLAGSLSPRRREQLTRAWAERVRQAAGHLPVVVMTPDQAAARWARRSGAQPIPDTGEDLNRSLAAALPRVRAAGWARVIIAHGDLALADDLTWLEPFPGVVIVPDRRDEGTNVLALPTHAPFSFRYGPASRGHHEQEARRLGLPITVVPDPVLGWDVDVTEDLGLPRGEELARLVQVGQRARKAAAAESVAGRP